MEANKQSKSGTDDLININNPYFESMVGRIYPPELLLNKAYASDIEAPFLDLHLFISNGLVSSKIHGKRDDFDFDIVFFFLNLHGDVPCFTAYGVIIPHLIGLSSHVTDFNIRINILTDKHLHQGYRYH